MSKNKQTPQHVAIIMDGNGRWAEIQGKERYQGHAQGVESVRASIRAAVKCGVNYLTLYAFSTENWSRDSSEVDALMELFCQCVVNETADLVKQGVKVKIIGDKTQLSNKVQDYLSIIESQTAEGDKLTLILALNYSSRREMTDAVRLIAERVQRGELMLDEISESTITNSLYTKSFPDPDFIIRTSGECRLSNFLLWQASYAEMYFPEILWPDFTEEEFEKAIDIYARRDRRFGLTK